MDERYAAAPLPGLIVLEGLDGSGTTTQSKMLVDHFVRGGVRAVFTCEPTSGPVGSLIRKVLSGEVPLGADTVAYLFAADRNEHLAAPIDGLRARSAAGLVSVCDRYLFSSLAYQGLSAGYDFVARLNGAFPLPVLTFYLDVSPETCEKRMASRPHRDLFEHLEVQRRVREAYETVLFDRSWSGMQLVRIDGNLSIDAVHAQIVEIAGRRRY